MGITFVFSARFIVQYVPDVSLVLCYLFSKAMISYYENNFYYSNTNINTQCSQKYDLGLVC